MGLWSTCIYYSSSSLAGLEVKHSCLYICVHVHVCTACMVNYEWQVTLRLPTRQLITYSFAIFMSCLYLQILCSSLTQSLHWIPALKTTLSSLWPMSLPRQPVPLSLELRPLPLPLPLLLTPQHDSRQPHSQYLSALQPTVLAPSLLPHRGWMGLTHTGWA